MPVSVIWIENSKMLEKEFKHILGEKIVGVDFEYGNSSYNQRSFKIITLVQLSTVERSYIIDGYKFYKELKIYLKQLCENRQILKLIHGSFYDLNLLYSFFQVKMVFCFDFSLAYRIIYNLKTSIGLGTLSLKFLDF